MNNNGMNFDPMTGQPLNNNGVTGMNNVSTQNPQINNMAEQYTQNVQPTMPQPQPFVNNSLNEQNNSQVAINPAPSSPANSVPTVEQNSESFINSTQAISSEKAPETKKGINYLLVIVLFLIIFAAILFAFPILKKYI